MRPSIDPAEAERRLLAIFPRAAFDTVMSSPLAGLAVAALIHVDAVSTPDAPAASVTWARPTTVLWMSTEALAHAADDERAAWRRAAAVASSRVEDLHGQWGVPFRPLYRENSRETLRDEVFREWLEHGAMRRRRDLAATSNRPRWALIDHFADLFDPALGEAAFQDAADAWRDKYLDPGSRLRARIATSAESAKHAVTVNLPDGTMRSLEPGKSSVIIKGVVEVWAANRLIDQVVLAISEPGDKVHVGDGQLLQALGIKIDVTNVLPDVLLADIGKQPVAFWVVEAVATDGLVTTARRDALLRWAGDCCTDR